MSPNRLTETSLSGNHPLDLRPPFHTLKNMTRVPLPRRDREITQVVLCLLVNTEGVRGVFSLNDETVVTPDLLTGNTTLIRFGLGDVVRLSSELSEGSV